MFLVLNQASSSLKGGFLLAATSLMMGRRYGLFLWMTTGIHPKKLQQQLLLTSSIFTASSLFDPILFGA